MKLIYFFLILSVSAEPPMPMPMCSNNNNMDSCIQTCLCIWCNTTNTTGTCLNNNEYCNGIPESTKCDSMFGYAFITILSIVGFIVICSVVICLAKDCYKKREQRHYQAVDMTNV